MSKKSDLLVRVRHLNPLPPPPFPPKLFNITTDIHRLGEPSYLNQLAASTPVPMIVDSEMGMPLDLNMYEGVWDGNEAALNPVPDLTRTHHPTDLILLAPPRRTVTGGVEKGPSATEVSWMRNASYISRRNNARRKEGAEAAEKAEAEVDVSEAAHLMSIDKSFSDVHEQKLDAIRHPDPKKRHLKVVEVSVTDDTQTNTQTYDILPDHETWANPYIMIKFPEIPSAATAVNPTAIASSYQLSRAVLRPIMEDEQQIMEYYLPEEKDLHRLEEAYENPIDRELTAELYAILENDPKDPKVAEIMPNNVRYNRIRTYEVITQHQPSKEVLLAFHEEETEDVPAADEPARKKRRGVYFKEIAMRTLLRKTRGQGRRAEIEERSDAWDEVRLGFRLPDRDEQEVQDDRMRLVTDPLWVDEQLRHLRGGDNMAEGLGEAIDDDEVADDSGVVGKDEEDDD